MRTNWCIINDFSMANPSHTFKGRHYVPPQQRDYYLYEMVSGGSGRSLAIDQATVLNFSKMTIFVVISIGIFFFEK